MWAAWDLAWEFWQTDCPNLKTRGATQYGFGFEGQNLIGRGEEILHFGAQLRGEKLCSSTGSATYACPRSFVTTVWEPWLFVEKPLDAAAGNPDMNDLEIYGFKQSMCQTVVPQWTLEAVKHATTIVSGKFAWLTSTFWVFVDIPNEVCYTNWDASTSRDGVEGLGPQVFDLHSWTGSREAVGGELDIDYRNAMLDSDFDLHVRGGADHTFDAKMTTCDCFGVADGTWVNWDETVTISVAP